MEYSKQIFECWAGKLNVQLRNSLLYRQILYSAALSHYGSFLYSVDKVVDITANPFLYFCYVFDLLMSNTIKSVA